MNENKAKIEISKLIKLINYHNKIYYEGKPEITDYQFDQLLKRLIKLENQFPDLIQKNSPTQNVGETSTKNFDTVKHLYPMLSLSNSYSKEEVTKYIERINKLLPEEKISFFCELKFDGSAISIIYENNKLNRVITRGDGTQGDNITENAKTIKNLPHEINTLYNEKTIEVRAEAFMSKKVFDKLNKERKILGEKLFANPRNVTAGTLKLLDKKEVSKRSLDYYSYTLTIDDSNIKTHEEGIKQLEKWGLNISKTYKKCDNLEDIFKYIDHWEPLRQTLPVEIDGIVIKVNNLNQQKRLGSRSKSPRWAIAFKYKPENLSTLLESVTFQVGRIGTITPVANLKPVLISGTIVKRASLHNPNEIKRLDVREGDTVFVEKGGEIIPKITSVDLGKRNSKCKPIKYPEYCPDCKTKLISSEDQANIYCPNSKKCPTQIKESIFHFASRNAMDIRELGPQTIERLYDQRLIKNVADLYDLKFSDIYKLEGFKEQSTRNLLDGIETSKNISFKKVLFALGLRHIGVSLSEKLALHYKNIDNLSSADFEELISIHEVGERVAQSILDYFEDSDNKILIKRLKHKNINFELKEDEIPKSNILEEKIFVISGVFNNFTREEMKSLIKNNGGKIVTSVSKNTDYLIIGNNPGPQKLDKADKLDIRTINEDDIQELIKK
ncbi:MAG: NAD-dependent DNA ligase LigA [Bacteroidetes bacterium]|nr:NAD-dependent DNA ligase LigA [Bacteroidota bacterium]